MVGWCGGEGSTKVSFSLIKLKFTTSSLESYSIKDYFFLQIFVLDRLCLLNLIRAKMITCKWEKLTLLASGNKSSICRFHIVIF